MRLFALLQCAWTATLGCNPALKSPAPEPHAPRDSGELLETPALRGPTRPPSRAISEKKYRLVVSFFSPGNGTDDLALKRLRELSEKRGVAYATGYWGKEGEQDECFELTELNDEGARAFVDEVRREIEARSRKVRVNEYAVCQSR